MIRKVCKALLEPSLNHLILTIKHLTITVNGEYTYGLPRLGGGAIGHCIQPIIYRMVKKMDSFNLSSSNLWSSVNQNHISRVSYKLCKIHQAIIGIMTMPQLNIEYQYIVL